MPRSFCWKERGRSGKVPARTVVALCLSLVDEVGAYLLFLLGNVLFLQVAQHPCHIASQHPHGLHTLHVLTGLAGGASVYAVPICGTDHRHIIYGEILVEAVKYRACSSPAAYRHGCGGLVSQQFSAGIEKPVQDGAKRSVGTGVIGRRPYNQSVYAFIQYVAELVVQIIGKATSSFLVTGGAGDATPYRFVADTDSDCVDTFFSQSFLYLLKGDAGVAVRVWTSIDEQYFHGRMCFFECKNTEKFPNRHAGHMGSQIFPV